MATVKHNISSYKQIVKTGNWAEKVELYKKLYEFSGVTDEALFDLIAADVENRKDKVIRARQEQEEFHWGIKALASSGNAKYIELMSYIVKHPKHRKSERHAYLAKNRLPEFTLWNPVLNSSEFKTPNRSDEEALYMRLISHGDMEMATFAVRKAQKNLSYNDKEFTEAVAKKLKEIYPQKTREKYSLEFQSWACKYLMLSKDAGHYRPLVKEISEKSPNKKVVKWAETSLNY